MSDTQDSDKQGPDQQDSDKQDSDKQGPDQHDDGHHPSLGVYFGVFAALLVLTAATVAVAFVDLGAWSAVVALAIAVTKGSLVILFFMHLRYESRLIALYATSGFGMLIILVAFTLAEMSDRPAQPERDPLRPSGALEPGPPMPVP